jgi:hypothetical protein
MAFLGSARWIGVRLDTIAALTLAVSVLLAMLVRGWVQPQLLGLALTHVLSLTGTVQWVLRQTVEVRFCCLAARRLPACWPAALLPCCLAALLPGARHAFSGAVPAHAVRPNALTPLHLLPAPGARRRPSPTHTLPHTHILARPHTHLPHPLTTPTHPCRLRTP